MKKIKLIVNTITQNYPIIIGKDVASNISQIASKNSIKFEKCLIVVDKNIPKNILAKIKRSLIKKKIFIHHIKAGDIGSFAASIFKRGLKLINVPTTLLSQVDSSVGGKTGVNTNLGKNLIGTFYQPNLVISDIDFLQSLPEREKICGYGEILKHSLINNKNFFLFLNKNFSKIINLKSPFIEKAIYESCKIKKKIVEKDEREKSLRKVLNFGHTFAHAYEGTLNFSKKLNHGEAVILGMQTALKFSLINKLLKLKEYKLIKKHISSSKLSMNLKKKFSIKDLDKILSYMSVDKKNQSKKVNLILLKKIGSPIINKEFGVNKLRTFLKNELSH